MTYYKYSPAAKLGISSITNTFKEFFDFTSVKEKVEEEDWDGVFEEWSKNNVFAADALAQFLMNAGIDFELKEMPLLSDILSTKNWIQVNDNRSK